MRNTFTQCVGLTILLAATIPSCKTIDPGEVCFIVHRGVIKPEILAPGRYHNQRPDEFTQYEDHYHGRQIDDVE